MALERYSAEEKAAFDTINAANLDKTAAEVADLVHARFPDRGLDAIKQRIFKLRREAGKPKKAAKAAAKSKAPVKAQPKAKSKLAEKIARKAKIELTPNNKPKKRPSARRGASGFAPAVANARENLGPRDVEQPNIIEIELNGRKIKGKPYDVAAFVRAST